MGEAAEAYVEPSGGPADRPVTLVRAVQLIWLLVSVAAVVTVLAVVFSDELLAAVVGRSGTSVDDTRVPPSFTPVVVVLYVCVASLVLVLMSFLQGGHNWARHCLAATALVIASGTLAGVRTEPPTVFVVLAVLSLLIEIALVVCLWHSATAAWVHRFRPERTR